MNRAKVYRLALREAQRCYPGQPAEELDDEVNDILSNWEAESASDREMFGEPEDSPCLEGGRDNCDNYGTGEGQFHGRI